MTQSLFTELPLSVELLSSLDSLSYTEMTPIQSQTLPAILDQQDVIGQAETGSGKTVAFGLGLLTHLNIKSVQVQGVVLCPTRELADQVARVLRQLARFSPNVKIITLCGGLPIGAQANSLEHGAHIVVGTPGRIHDHLRNHRLSLESLQTLVFDEADRMLDMGFQNELDAIMDYMPAARQTLLFSATYPENIQELSRQITNNAIHIQVKKVTQQSTITHHFYELKDAQKERDQETDSPRLDLLKSLLLRYPVDSTVIFCNMRAEVQEIVDALYRYGFHPIGLHGELDQKMRDQVLVRFSNKSASILVATDVAGRGLDIDGLDLVINYQLPRDLESYVHRVGRTGRAGNIGQACTLFLPKEKEKLSAIKAHLGDQFKIERYPDLNETEQSIPLPNMITIAISLGKKQKIRPTDILGTLTNDTGILGSQVGKIHLFDYISYVAIERDLIKQSLDKLNNYKLKGKACRAWVVRG